ncbi:AraC family transcriptional regulator [Sphingobacterium sp. UT-1RO-CII-1]|uniref:AraC family transcriptional regulator n=1 Tax=Sphingobacterium sp. UT-1RO-CII-1 TaxID=2995225 RepID=UPI00227BD00F|nr:AraC family transcriptional regulator [Sphingobacterium sp. UT-1RO-CII-1]MCY4781486.1 AraC family transcriptional regulator [Sphingobacterium sp. UT-1RO-CII-1]
MKIQETRKPIEFTVPTYGEDAFYVMEDIGEFYGYYHRHREFQISYIVKGSGSLMIGNLLRTGDEGDVFLIKPNDPHLFYKENSVIAATNVHIVHLFFSLDKLETFFNMAELSAIKNLFYHLESSKMLSGSLGLNLRDLFRNLKHEKGSKKLMRVLEVFSLILQREKDLISLYSGLTQLDFHESDGIRINTVIKYALDNYKRNLTVDEVSSLIHMTSTAFCKFFKKHTQKTFVTFLNEVRVEKACQLLVNKRVESISEAAYQCGFNTAVHFNRVFKNIMKVSPTEFVAQRSIEEKSI